MRILMFGWEFPPHNSGGLGVACFGLSKSLVQRGTELIFVLPKQIPTKAIEAHFRFADIYFPSLSFRVVSSSLKPYITAESYRQIHGVNTPSLYEDNLISEVYRYALRARELARQESFDVIHAHDWLSFLAGIAAKEATEKPLIVHVHATEFDRTGGNGVNQSVYDIERRGMEVADQVIAVSQFTKDILITRYNIPEGKITVVHNGIDTEEGGMKKFGVSSTPSALTSGLLRLKEAGNKIVLFVGRITLQKGPDYFIQSALRVLSIRPNTFFVMCGAGDMREKMIRSAAYQNISNRFIFTSWLVGEELDTIYQVADLFVMPSVSEPFGITPLEALANGTPVLISKQSGVAEIIPGALKVDFWDVEEMANKIVAVLDHPSLGYSVVSHGQDSVSQFSWKRAADACIEIYKRFIKTLKPL